MLLKVESDGGHFSSFLYLSNSTEPQILSTVKEMMNKQRQRRLSVSESISADFTCQTVWNQDGAETELNCRPELWEGLAIAFWEVCLFVCLFVNKSLWEKSIEELPVLFLQ